MVKLWTSSSLQRHRDWLLFERLVLVLQKKNVRPLRERKHSLELFNIFIIKMRMSAEVFFLMPPGERDLFHRIFHSFCDTKTKIDKTRSDLDGIHEGETCEPLCAHVCDYTPTCQIVQR